MGSLNVNRRLFKRSTGISLIALVALLTLLVATGSVFAASPIAGVGGFTIGASSITGTGFELIPNLTNTNTGSGNGTTLATGGPASLQNQYQKVYPAAQVALATAAIVGLDLSKNISLAAIATQFGISPSTLSYVKVEITSTGTVTGQNLILNATDIYAGNAHFNNMNMMENLPTQNPNYLTELQQDTSVTKGIFGSLAGAPDDDINTGVQIGLAADYMVLTDGIINTHSMKADSMDIPNMKLQLHLFDSSNHPITTPFQNHGETWDNVPAPSPSLNTNPQP